MSRRKLARRQRLFQFEALDSRLLMSGDIHATVFEDVNGNGVQDAADRGLAGWSVFVDFNKNGVHDAGEPQQTTDANGVATIAAVPKGTWDVREIVQSGFAVVGNGKDLDHVSVHDGAVSNTSYLNVSLTSGAIQGTVWNDVNDDGVRDPGDNGLAGWTVFIDQNTNRILDAGEPSAVTDANGQYTFSDLTPGRYKVREITPAGWNPTLGADGQNTVDVSPGRAATSDFGNFNVASIGSLKGVVWNDVNADGIRAAGDPGLGGWTVFLDLNNDGVQGVGEPGAVTDAGGNYSFPSLTVGTYTVREVVQPGWNLSPGHPNPQIVSVASEGITTADFAVWTPTLGSISGQVWNDQNGDGLLQFGEPGLSGWTVFMDQNSNGTLDAGEPSVTTDSIGSYTFTDVAVGAQVIREIPAVGWSATAPGTGQQLVNVPNGTSVTNINFGNKQRTDAGIGGTAFDDVNHNGVRDLGERGLSGITVYLDTNNNGTLDAGEPSTTTSTDLFYTPAVDEAGAYLFTHLPAGTYNVREIVPIEQSATPAAVQDQVVSLATGELRSNVDFANQYRAGEIHGVKFDDLNGNRKQDPGEPGMPGVTVWLDLNRNGLLDAGEPSTVTDATGAYAFTGLAPGAYVVRAKLPTGHEHTYPTTTGGILWPTGVSNPAIGNVTPTSITTSLAEGETFNQTVSLTLPSTGALTDKADVFLLFDDTGSFTANSPIVRAAFPTIISSLQAALPGLDLGFGVGRFEEYANFASEFATGRPFILNQSIVSRTTPGFSAAIQSALDRTAPGYGGDQPETDIEALFQMVTGAGFDGNNNGTTTDSGAAGLVSTQLTPGGSGDVPAFSSFTPDAAGNVLAPEGQIGGAGFRPGALPIILLATDTGFAYQPKGETSVTGVNGLTLPISQLTQLSRPTTPFNSGAGIQETVTGLNALGALVIGLGTNSQTTLDPRQQLESLAKLTGAINRTTTPISNGTPAPIAPGDPLYFQIASGFGTSVADGVTAAIQNAATSVAVNVELKASDPRVHITMTPGVVIGVGAGQTATFNVTFTGDGRPERFDLQFVRQGTNVVLGSIPVVLGTPIPDDGYEYEDIGEGEIHKSSDFGSIDSHRAGMVSGNVFEDRNGNGLLDTGEAPMASVTVYADVNHSGTFDVGEPSAATDATGGYQLTGLTSGSYTLRQVTPSGSIATGAAAAVITVALPATVDGQNFGTFPTAISGSAADNTYYVRGDGANVDIWVNAATTTTPTYSIARSLLPDLAFSGSTGQDSLVVDASGTSPSPAGGISFDGGENLDSLTALGSAGNDSITASASAVTINGVTVNFTGNEELVLDPGAGTDALNVNAGTVQLAPGGATRAFSAINLAAGARLDVTTNALTTNATMPAIVAALSSGQIFSSHGGGGVGYLDLGAGQAELRFTLLGDTNLDGTVDVTDLGNLASSYGAAGGAALWVQGDTNYDGSVDVTDLGNLASNYGAALGGTTLAAAVPLTQVAPVTTAKPAAMVAAAPSQVSSATAVASLPPLHSDDRSSDLFDDDRKAAHKRHGLFSDRRI